MKISAQVLAITAVLAAVAAPEAALAKETESAELRCGSATYTVTGFGRGTPLKLSDSTSNYVVTFARREPSGEVLLDNRGQRKRSDLVECTVTAPSGTHFTLRGFFTPRR